MIWFYRSTLRITWTGRVSNEEVLRKIEIRKFRKAVETFKKHDEKRRVRNSQADIIY